MTMRLITERVFLFDVDGTITPNRQKMTDTFSDEFYRFASLYPVYLISGSNIEKIAEQVPEQIMNSVSGIFACSGAQFWRRGHTVFKRAHQFDPMLLALLDHFVAESDYPIRLGQHVEIRIGAVNVSTVGRAASISERQAYYEWDLIHGERQLFRKFVEQTFPNYEANCGGMISLDITPRGLNKSQIIPYLRVAFSGPIVFFGDTTKPGGNDYPLAVALREDSSYNMVHQVTGPDETLALLFGL